MSDERPDELGPDAPVYDARGNVRPHGTEGARPMTYEERVEIARRIEAGEDPAADSDAVEESEPEPEPEPKLGQEDRCQEVREEVGR